MRVLVADAFEESGKRALLAMGCEVVDEPKLKDAALVEAIATKRPDVLVVRSTQVTEAALAAGNLKLVVRAGAGYNTIDVVAASRRGIYVANCPGKNAVAVAELVLGLILALDRRIADNVIALREGKWMKGEFSKARGLYGRTLGVVGIGQIGREVITRAKAFGMEAVAFSRSMTAAKAEEMGVGYAKTLEDLAKQSDVVSVHVALSKETRGLIGESFFAAMKVGAHFVNTARGEVVDEAALLRAMREKKIRVGLDVYAQEPAGSAAEFADPIAKEINLYGTHHIGASTEQAQEAIAAETVRIIRSFKEAGQVPNAVNIARRTPAICALVVRHRDRPGVLANVLDAISAARINVQEMENTIFDGAEAAVARINLEREPDDATLEKIRRNEDVIEVGVIGLGG